MKETWYLERDIAESIIHNKVRNLSDLEIKYLLLTFKESWGRKYCIVDKLPKEGNVIKRITDF